VGDDRVEFGDGLEAAVDRFEVGVGAGQAIADDHLESCDCFDFLYIHV
jgi:hypothetical protein